MKLLTICFSHFNEKARWALERYGVPFEERGYMPMFHMLPVARAKRGRGRAGRGATKYSTPCLVLDDGSVVPDSSDILAWVDEHHAGGALFPDEEVRRFEKEVGGELGYHTRRVAYWHLLQVPGVATWLADHNVGRAQAIAFRGLAPFFPGMLRRALRITPDGYERSRNRVFEMADEIADHLGDRQYLFGNAATGADLAIAALGVPMALADWGYAAEVPPLEEVPSAREDALRFRATPLGRYIERMYRDHRREVVA